MPRTRTSWVLALVGTLFGCGDSPVSPIGRHDSPNLLIAADPTENRYPNVGLMVGRVVAGSPWTPACSGTVIAPDVVLTAGHCVVFGPLFEGFTEWGVTFDAVFTAASPVIRATARLHPDFNFRFPFPTADDPADFFDMAVLLLERPVDLIPAQLPPAGFLDRVGAMSGPLTVVGYGLPRADASWDERGTRRVGSVRLDRVVGPVVATTPDPALICIGDSGGPLFFGPGYADRGQRGVTTILGIAQSADCATFSGFYRVDTPQARAFLSGFVDLSGGTR